MNRLAAHARAWETACMGKKIKKSPGAMRALKESQVPDQSPRIAPYVLAKGLDEGGAIWMSMTEAERAKAASVRLTPSAVERMSTEEIVDKLRALGVDALADQASFVAQAEKHHSAWEVSTPHADAVLARGASAPDVDFVSFSSVTLWRRWMTRPSIEQIFELFDEGFRADDGSEESHDEMIDAWSRGWKLVRTMLDDSMTTFADAERKLDPIARFLDLEQWLMDIAGVYAASSDSAEDGVRFIDEMLLQFRDERATIRKDLLVRKAEMLVEEGRLDEMMRVLEDLIAIAPRESTSYIVSAALAVKAERPDDASAFIERGLALPVDDVKKLKPWKNRVRRTSEGGYFD
jgi:hypothetical protein